MQLNEIIKDQDFLDLPDEEKVKVLKSIDPSFSDLPDIEKAKVLSAIPAQIGEQQVEQPVQPAPQNYDGGTFIDVAASEGFPVDPRKTISNIPSDALGYGKSILNFAAHPLDSANLIGRVMGGAVQSAVATEDSPMTEDRELYDNFMGFYKDRYGSLDRIAKSIEEHPVETAADASTLLMGAGGLTKLMGKATGSQSVMSAGKSISNVGKSIEPVTAAATLVSKGVQKAIRPGWARSAYQSAVKFSTTLSTAEREKLAQTALDAGIMPTVKGVEKLTSLIDDIDTQIAGMIKEGTKQGLTVPTYKLFKYLGKVEVEARGTLMEQEAISAVRKVKKNLLEKMRDGRVNMTPDEVQFIKKDIYKSIKTTYGDNQYHPYSVKTQKAIARAAKVSLEELFPEIKSLNQKDGDYIALMDAIEQKANRISNRDLLGIGIPLKGTTGGVIGGTTGMAIGVVAGILDTPQVKAKLSIVANKLQKQGIPIITKGAAFRVGLFNIARDRTTEKSDWKNVNVKAGKITDEDVSRLLSQGYK